MKNEWILGREGDIKVDHPSVGRRHARLTRKGEELTIEDLDSTNGTYVDGAPVKIKKITLSSKILLGTCEIDLKSIGLPLSDGEYASELKKLKGTYEAYQKQKLLIESNSAWQMAIKRLWPSIIVVFFLLVLGYIKEDFDKGGTLRMILSVVAMSIGGLFVAKGQGGKTKKLLELNENFKIGYVCPDCKVWFGDIPWEGVCNQGKCPRCRRSI